jgi:hypothetical protein
VLPGGRLLVQWLLPVSAARLAVATLDALLATLADPTTATAPTPGLAGDTNLIDLVGRICQDPCVRQVWCIFFCVCVGVFYFYRYQFLYIYISDTARDMQALVASVGRLALSLGLEGSRGKYGPDLRTQHSTLVRILGCVRRRMIRVQHR